MYPAYNQQLSQMLLQQSMPQMAKREIVKVNGRGGADAFQMQPNESDLLLDTTAPIVWLVQTDGAGYKTVTGYDITPHEEKPQEDVYKSLEDRIKKLEEVINAKPDTSNAKRKSAE